MIINNEAIEAAKQAQWYASDFYNQCGGELKDHPQREETYERIARRVLEAAAPFMESEALEDAALEMFLPGIGAIGYYSADQDTGYREAERHMETWLTTRAKLIALQGRREGEG